MAASRLNWATGVIVSKTGVSSSLVDYLRQHPYDTAAEIASYFTSQGFPAQEGAIAMARKRYSVASLVDQSWDERQVTDEDGETLSWFAFTQKHMNEHSFRGMAAQLTKLTGAEVTEKSVEIAIRRRGATKNVYVCNDPWVTPTVAETIWKDNPETLVVEKIPASERQTVIDENNISQDTLNTQIKSSGEQAAACGIDLTVWFCDSMQVTTYKVSRRNDQIHLQFEGDKKFGTHDTDPTMEMVYSVRCVWKRIQPVVTIPTLKSVHVVWNGVKEIPIKPEGPVKRVMLAGDTHFGYRYISRRHVKTFHDRSALLLFEKICSEKQPDDIHWGGDILDLVEFSKFPNDPDVQQTTQAAIVEASYWIRRLREACPRATISIHQGNHDDRIRRAIAKLVPGAFNLRRSSNLNGPPAMSVPGLVDLDDVPNCSWTDWYPNDELYLRDDFSIRHGDKSSTVPGYTVRNELQNLVRNTCIFHSHVMERAQKMTDPREDGRTVCRGLTAFTPGILCRNDGTVEPKGRPEKWDRGFAYVEYSPKTFGFLDVHLMKIEEDGSYNRYAAPDADEVVEDLYTQWPDFDWA